MRHRLKLPISAEQIRRIVRHQFGRKAQVTGLSSIRGGLFNTAYKLRLNDHQTVVLRIAPPKDKPLLVCETALLEREIYSFHRLHEYGLPVPKLLCADLSKTIIDRNYIISEFSEGHNAFYRLKQLTTREQDSVFGELGDYARRIHSIKNPEKHFGYPAPLTPHRRWSEFVRWHLLSLCREMEAHPYLSLPDHISVPSILDKLGGVLDEIAIPRLVHGDLWLRNILIKRHHGNYRITAILDWDRSLWGDPYFEWILHGLDLRPIFWEKYGSEIANPESHQKRRLLYKAGGCLQACLEDNLHFRLKKQSIQMLGYAVGNFNELLKIL